MPQEESSQTPQTPQAAPKLPAGVGFLLTVVGIPLALHALTGAAVGVLTFAVGTLFVGLTKGEKPKSPGLSSARRSVASETTA